VAVWSEVAVSKGAPGKILKAGGKRATEGLAWLVLLN